MKFFAFLLTLTYLLVALGGIVTTGCATYFTPTIDSLVQKKWTPNPRCKVIGKAHTPNVAVLVEKNCLKNGLTSVNIIVLSTKKDGKKAAEEGVKLVTKILGFKPKLGLLFYGKAKGLPFFMCAVMGVAD
ncbi:MAG: hypothetical protein KAS32_04615 [Candidatus Peribacteraceae bacterium]|nr:hypothetical protein [Candidatus Peribacteraceae bacterium]